MQAYDLRKTARENLRGNWPISIAASLIAWLLGGLVVGSGIDFRIISKYLPKQGTFTYVIVTLGILGSLTGLAELIIGGTVRLGYSKFLLKQHDHREKPEIGDLFSEFGRFTDGLCLLLLQSLYVILWSLLLFIPGIVAGYRYAMAPYLMQENPGMTASEAIKASGQMMQGHKGELFMLDLSFLGWAFLAAITFGIGRIFLNPYTNAAHAAFYRSLCAQQQTAP